MKLQAALQSETLRQTLWALSGNIGYAIAQWGMLIALTRYTSTETVGQYALALAICAPVVMLANMRLRLVLAADSHNSYNFFTYRRVRLITSLFGFTSIVVGSYLLFDDFNTLAVIILIAAAKSIESISDIYYGLFQKYKFIHKMCTSLLIKGAISFSVFFVSLKYSDNITYAYVSLSLSWLALLIFYDIPTARKIIGKDGLAHNRSGDAPTAVGAVSKPNINSKTMALIRSAIVLGLVALVGSLFTNVTRYVIGSTLGNSQLGLYAAIAYIGIAGQLVAASLAQPVMPNLALNYKNNDMKGFSKYYWYLIGLALLLGISGVLFVYLFGEYFLLIVYGEVYAKQNDIFMLAIISSSLGYFILFQWYTLTAMNKLKEQLVLSVLTIVILTSLSLYLTPIYGVSGAIFAEIIAMGFHVLLGLWLVQINVKMRLQISPTDG